MKISLFLVGFFCSAAAFGLYPPFCSLTDVTNANDRVTCEKAGGTYIQYWHSNTNYPKWQFRCELEKRRIACVHSQADTDRLCNAQYQANGWEIKTWCRPVDMYGGCP